MFMKARLTTFFGVILILATLGCTKQFTPQPLEQLNVVARAQVQSVRGVTVSAAVLGADESRHVFGVDLARIGVQPVWLNIKNGTDEQQYFLPMSVDTDYFAPHEVWWKTRYKKDREASERMEELFNALLMPMNIAPRSEASGFVLTRLHSGSVRMINVDVLGMTDLHSFNFFLKIPGFLADHQRVDFATLYRNDQLIHCNTVSGLQYQLGKLPCCVTNKAGDKQGDPLNIVIVTTPNAAWRAMVRRGWDETEPITLDSSIKTVDAFMARKEYRTSPISPLYVFGRGQDIGLQKARKTIHERNHLRLWLTPIRFRDNYVWIGSISRDIGVKMTTKTWSLTTHEIDGDVDEARAYLVQDMAYSQALKELAHVRSMPPVSKDAPRLNLTDSAWYTDGLRAVMFLTDDDTPLYKVRQLDWQHPPALPVQ